MAIPAPEFHPTGSIYKTNHKKNKAASAVLRSIKLEFLSSADMERRVYEVVEHTCESKKEEETTEAGEKKNAWDQQQEKNRCVFQLGETHLFLWEESYSDGSSFE